MHSRVHWRSICKRVCEWSSTRQNGRVVSAFIFQCDMPSSNLRKSAYVLSLMRVHASHTTSPIADELSFAFYQISCVHSRAEILRLHACNVQSMTRAHAWALTHSHASFYRKSCVHMHAMYSLWRVHTHVLPQKLTRAHAPFSRIDTRFLHFRAWLGKPIPILKFGKKPTRQLITIVIVYLW